MPNPKVELFLVTGRNFEAEGQASRRLQLDFNRIQRNTGFCARGASIVVFLDFMSGVCSV